MMGWRSSAIDGLAKLVPFKSAIVGGAARLPPPFRRSTLWVRVMSELAVRARLPATVRTNMGIDSALSFEVPATHTDLLFGSPKTAVGERASLELCARFASGAGAFIDVGANAGFYTAFIHARLARTGGCQIYCFEPDRDLYARLAANLSRNGMRRVIAINAAADQASGETLFHPDLTTDSSGTLDRTQFAQHTFADPVRVSAIALADFAAERDLSHICAKIDVEGAEARVWNGIAREAHRFDAIVIELLAAAVSENLQFRIASESGMHAYYINDFRLEHAPLGAFRYVAPQFNWLFCRLGPGDLARRLGAAFTVV